MAPAKGQLTANLAKPLPEPDFYTLSARSRGQGVSDAAQLGLLQTFVKQECK